MSLQLMPAAVDTTALEQQIADAKAAAKAADDKAANARQMVLNRDPTLTSLTGDVTSLQQVADTVTALNQASVSDRAAIHAQLDALNARALTGQVKRYTTTALLALNANTNVTVTWDTPFPDSNYLVLPLFDGSGAGFQVTAVTKTPASCNLTIKALVALAIGSTINVVGLRFG